MSNYYFVEHFRRYFGSGLTAMPLIQTDNKVIAYGGQITSNFRTNIDDELLKKGMLVTYNDNYNDNYYVDFHLVYKTKDEHYWGSRTTNQIGAIHYALNGPIVWVDLDEVVIADYWLIVNRDGRMLGLDCSDEKPRDFSTAHYYDECKLIKCMPKIENGKLKIDYKVVEDRIPKDWDYDPDLHRVGG